MGDTDAHFQQVDELGEVALLLGQGLQQLQGGQGVRGGGDEALHRSAGSQVLRMTLQGLAERAERPVQVIQRPGAQLTQAEQELGLRLHVVFDLGFALQDLGQLTLSAAAGQQPIQGRQRLHLVAGQLQHLAVAGDGARVIQ